MSKPSTLAAIRPSFWRCVRRQEQGGGKDGQKYYDHHDSRRLGWTGIRAAQRSATDGIESHVVDRLP